MNLSRKQREIEEMITRGPNRSRKASSRSEGLRIEMKGQEGSAENHEALQDPEIASQAHQAKIPAAGTKAASRSHYALSQFDHAHDRFRLTSSGVFRIVERLSQLPSVSAAERKGVAMACPLSPPGPNPSPFSSIRPRLPQTVAASPCPFVSFFDFLANARSPIMVGRQYSVIG